MSGELIERMAKAMVDNPEQVKVTETLTDRLDIIELHVAKEDVGKVIGKKGQNARAMRHLLQAASSKERTRATLEIINQ